MGGKNFGYKKDIDEMGTKTPRKTLNFSPSLMNAPLY